jgi:hypothetical protein
MSRKPVIILFWGAALLAVAPLRGAMYRWVDEHGQTVYSQSPPPPGNAVRIKPRLGPSADEAKAAQERLQRQIESNFDAREERKRVVEEQAKKDEATKQRAEYCAAARKNLETLQNLGPRMVRMPDGEYTRLSENEVAAEIRKTEDEIAKHCK